MLDALLLTISQLPAQITPASKAARHAIGVPLDVIHRHGVIRVRRIRPLMRHEGVGWLITPSITLIPKSTADIVAVRLGENHSMDRLQHQPPLCPAVQAGNISR